MAQDKEKNFIKEIIFCINESDVIKAKALVQYFSEVGTKVQKRVLYELSKSADEIAYPVLTYICGLTNVEKEIKETINDLVLEISYGNSELLINSIKNKDLDNRKVFIKSAGDLKCTDTVSTLVEILSTETEMEVVEETIRALGSIGSDECVAALSIFLNSEDVVLKNAGINALSEAGTSDAIDKLSESVSGDNNTDQNIVAGLAAIQNMQSMEKLSGLLSSSYVNIRSMAIENLIKIGEKSVPSLIEKLQSKNTDLVVHTLTVLGGIGDKAAVPAIQKLIHSNPDESNIRFGAYEALGRLPSAKTAISLATGLEDPDEQVRMAAAKAIDNNLTPVLIAGLKNMIKAGDDQSNEIVATFLNSQADNVFDSLVDWEEFTEAATDYLAKNAHPETKDHYLAVLKEKGKADIVEKVQATEETVPEISDRITIFAVDDSSMMLRLYKKKLYDMGYEPVTFQFPVEAIKAAKEKKPGLIITDLNMPYIDGLQLSKEIRSVYDSKQLPIIMITTQSDFKRQTTDEFLKKAKTSSTGKTKSASIDEESIKKYGIDTVLYKPFTDNDLSSTIKHYLGK